MKNKFNILLAPDSFKGSLSATSICSYLREGILDDEFHGTVTQLPLADGGEGTVEAMVEALGGTYCKVIVQNPLKKPVEAVYGIVRNGQMAVIEMAAASGLELIDKNDRNPMIATTYGTGELIRDALDKGCRQFIIGIGGSATNDGGAGMLEALGLRLFSRNPSIKKLQGGGSLHRISAIDLSTLDERLHESRFQIACDVTNPLVGDQGATMVYASQKGAQPKDLPHLEEGLLHWGKLLENVTNRIIIEAPGSGAAGGLGAGFLTLPHSKLKSGFTIIQNTVHLEEHIKKADLIITGEGKVDGQTIYGKVVSGIGKLAQRYQKPVICLAGTVDKGSELLLDHGITALFSIVDRPMSLDEAITATPNLLRQAGKNIIRFAVAFSSDKR